eukprot:SAG31_NODE_600_length_13647_cov_3.894376_2_plen_167_part_00
MQEPCKPRQTHGFSECTPILCTSALLVMEHFEKSAAKGQRFLITIRWKCNQAGHSLRDTKRVLRQQHSPDEDLMSCNAPFQSHRTILRRSPKVRWPLQSSRLCMVPKASKQIEPASSPPQLHSFKALINYSPATEAQFLLNNGYGRLCRASNACAAAPIRCGKNEI